MARVRQVGASDVSRRDLLTLAVSLLASGTSLRATRSRPGLQPGGRLIGTVPFTAARAPDAPPLGRLLGSGLDARLFTDLSAIDRDAATTPNSQFFVRTAAPSTLESTRPWTFDVTGLVARPQRLTLDSLEKSVAAAGTHIIECAGNAHPANFGLISAARWEGVPLLPLIERAQPRSGARYVQVSGVDEAGEASQTSVPGCSWIFSRDDLERANAFLAVRMNGAPVPLHHGAPVRLVVPGWYGCSCVKWVNRLELVPDDAPPTPQMKEYAGRIHQQGEARLASEFAPATIDTSALPVRVEKWLRDGRIVYRVVGITWGGSTPADALLIRFTSDGPWVRVDECCATSTTNPWTVWSHWWRPEVARRYQITLKVADPSVRTRRLDASFYLRETQIDDV
jgi:DMSO/TMAO reductase YedYZ molybdopterin-dependent catalytic subunit